MSLLGSLEHHLRLFGLGLKREVVGDVSSLSAWQSRAPVFRQIQLAVDEGVAGGGDVGEEDADLTVFHAVGESAILGSDASGVVTAFGKATFVNDKHGKALRE